MTEIYNYFQEHNLNSFEEVKKHFKTWCKINETDDYYLLRYRRVDGNIPNNPILNLLRGTIFNKLTNKIVCYPMAGANTLEDF